MNGKQAKRLRRLANAAGGATGYRVLLSPTEKVNHSVPMVGAIVWGYLNVQGPKILRREHKQDSSRRVYRSAKRDYLTAPADLC
jgi:hypothetical protein